MDSEIGRRLVEAILADAKALTGRDPLLGEVLNALTFAFAVAVQESEMNVEEALALHAQQVRSILCARLPIRTPTH